MAALAVIVRAVADEGLGDAVEPLVAGPDPGPALALLLGVNIGPNLTYVGSLATMLWLRVVRREGEHPSLATFTRHGLLTVPPALIGATLALWASLQWWGPWSRRVLKSHG